MKLEQSARSFPEGAKFEVVLPKDRPLLKSPQIVGKLQPLLDTFSGVEDLGQRVAKLNLNQDLVKEMTDHRTCQPDTLHLIGSQVHGYYLALGRPERNCYYSIGEIKLL